MPTGVALKDSTSRRAGWHPRTPPPSQPRIVTAVPCMAFSGLWVCIPGGRELQPTEGALAWMPGA